jgi:hypothetical protein
VGAVLFHLLLLDIQRNDQDYLCLDTFISWQNEVDKEHPVMLCYVGEDATYPSSMQGSVVHWQHIIIVMSYM